MTLVTESSALPQNKTYINLKKKYMLFFLMGGIIGMVVFLCVYGILILNPTYDDWIISQYGDMNQHYTGWEFYRNTEWRFPYGLLDGLSTDSVSIMYTDSIPIFAVFFKILSPILPETFQYFGIWGIFCFFLQGGFGCLIIRRFTDSVAMCGISSLVFSMPVVVFQRMFGHTALAANWIILACMALWLYSSNIKTYKIKALLWCALCVIAVNVHFYYVPMVLAYLCGYILWDLINNKKVLPNIITLGCSGVSIFISMYCLGAFYGPNNALSVSGLGLYSANLNTFINSMNAYSKFLKPLLVATDGQGEGIAYLGLGVIIGFFMVILLSLRFFINNGIKGTWKYAKSKKAWIISITAVFVVTMFVAISPKATFGARILYEINYPQKIVDLLTVFRASGRFAWVAMYMIITFTLVMIIKNADSVKLGIVVLAAVVFVQYYDLKPFMINLHNNFAVRKEFSEPLKDEKWDELSKQCEHIVFLPLPADYLASMQMYYTFGHYAHENGMDLSSFNVSRVSYEVLKMYTDDAMEDIKNKNADEKTLYVFFGTEDDVPVYKGFECETLDGYVVGYVKQ